MSSYSSPLPPYVTPGWNDPPTNLNTEHKKNPSFAAHRHRRPVDPSIQGSVRSTPTPTPTQQHQFHPLTLNKNNLTSNSATHLGTYHSRSQTNMSSTGTKSLHDAASSSSSSTTQRRAESQHRAIYDAFTIPSAASQEPFDFARINPALIPPENQPHVSHSSSIPFQQNFTNENSTLSASITSNIPTTNFAPLAPGPPIESSPNALIYTPPNTVGEINQRPATSPDPASYVAPMKAAGDVSLSGLQLVQFITKATLRLPPGVTRDGIQLRIAHFNDLVSANAVSDGLVKKLNFVVDALDRGLYDEALQFFEQMQSAYAEETKTSWAQGLRLLIYELKRPARSGSAGVMRH